MIWKCDELSDTSKRFAAGLGSPAAVLLCAMAFTLVFTSQGWSEQSAPLTITVDEPPPGPSSPARPAAPVGIKGIRIEANGALITGPLNARRVYIRLDSPVMPSRFQALWIGDQALCAPAREASKSNPEKLPDGSILFTERNMFGRQTYTIEEVFVPIPSTFTLDMLESGKQLILPASDYQSTSEALVIFSRPDKTRDYMELSLAEDGQKLTVRTQNGRESGKRCNP